MPRRLQLIPVLALLSLVACGGGSSDHAEPAPAAAPAPAPPARDTSGLSTAVDGMDDVLAAYLDQAELLAQDQQGASHGEPLATALAEVSLDPAPEWLAGLETASKQYGEAADIAAARKAFSQLSGAMVAYVETHQSALEMHKVRCPMAPEGIEGTWLQAGAEVHNPWYGSDMLACGVKAW